MAIKKGKIDKHGTRIDSDVNRVLRLLRNAQFGLGKKTDSVKLIRKERSER